MAVPTLASDGNWRVSWVTTIANIAAPTVAELNAGTELAQNWITPEGLNIPTGTAGRTTSTLGADTTTQRAARKNYDGSSVTCYRAEPPQADTAYDLLTYGTDGYLVVRRTLPNATAYASAQKVEVYPFECGEPSLSPPAENATQTFTTPFFLTSPANTRATIA
jgi:hypothetical protein